MIILYIPLGCAVQAGQVRTAGGAFCGLAGWQPDFLDKAQAEMPGGGAGAGGEQLPIEEQPFGERDHRDPDQPLQVPGAGDVLPAGGAHEGSFYKM